MLTFDPMFTNDQEVEFFKNSAGKFFVHPHLTCVMSLCIPFLVKVEGNHIIVSEFNGTDPDPEVIVDDTIKSYGGVFYDSLEKFIRNADDGMRTGFIQTNIAGRILYIYDHRPEAEILNWPDGSKIEADRRGWYTGGNFGYALNLDYFPDSEWGYAQAFPMKGETDQDQLNRQAEGFKQAVEFVGGIENVIYDGVSIVGRSQPVQ